MPRRRRGRRWRRGGAGASRREYRRCYKPTRESSVQTEDPIRDQAFESLKKKRDFKSHLIVYIAVNALLVGIRIVTRGDNTIFWPIFPILGWGIGVSANGWDAYRRPISEADIQREADKLRGS